MRHLLHAFAFASICGCAVDPTPTLGEIDSEVGYDYPGISGVVDFDAAFFGVGQGTTVVGGLTYSGGIVGKYGNGSSWEPAFAFPVPAASAPAYLTVNWMYAAFRDPGNQVWMFTDPGIVAIGAPPGGAMGKPLLAYNLDGRLEITIRGSDGCIWTIAQLVANLPAPANAPWGAWRKITGPVAGNPVPIRRTDATSFYAPSPFYVLGADHAIWQYTRLADGSYTGRSLGGYVDSEPSVAYTKLGLTVLVRGTDGAVWSTYPSTDGWFGPWTRATSSPLVFAFEPTLSMNADGSIEMFAVDASTHVVWHSIQRRTKCSPGSHTCPPPWVFGPYESLDFTSDNTPRPVPLGFTGLRCVLATQSGTIVRACQELPGVWNHVIP